MTLSFILLAVVAAVFVAWLFYLYHRDTHPGPIPGDPDVRNLPTTGAWFKRIGTQGRDRIGELRFRIFDRNRQDTAEKGPRP